MSPPALSVGRGEQPFGATSEMNVAPNARNVENSFENDHGGSYVSSVAGARRFLALECEVDRATFSQSRLRAWSGITGWRFKSSSARCRRVPVSGLTCVAH